MGYVIYVAEKLAEIRDFKINEILNIRNKPVLNKTSKFLGGINQNPGKNLPKFLNWYDNPDYIQIWKTKKEAIEFMDFLIERGNKYYKTSKDPFSHLINTKGDWKNYYFIVVKLAK